MKIERHTWSTSVSLTASSSTTEAIDYRNASGGMIIVPASVTSLTWYASDAEDGTFVQVNDKANSGAATPTSVTAARAYNIPDECFGAPWLKVVANTTGTATFLFKT